MFHLNDKGDVRPCTAKIPSNCKFFKSEDNTRHFKTVEEALKVSEKELSSEYASSLSGSKKQITYSFMSKFEKLEEEFNEDFDGVPNRFFNTDLMKDVGTDKSAKELQEILMLEEIGENKGSIQIRFNVKTVLAKCINSFSSPNDSNVPFETMANLAKDLGIENIEEFDASKHRPDKMWTAEWDGQKIVITDKPFGKIFYKYRTPGIKGSFYTYTIRQIVALNRLKKKTNLNVDKIGKATGAKTLSDERKHKILGLEIVKRLQDEQLKGRNFIAQKKHVKSHNSSVARAWTDKKNPDKVHRDLMDNHSLSDSFSLVEMDNDVDPKEFHDFQDQIKETMPRIPQIPEEMKPELRIRKLGKHKASGMYFPHKNTVCVDVRTSESFIHEMGHYYDFAMKNNASLTNDFMEFTRDYSKALGETDKRDYYTTPTEIFARGWELYAHKKLGIDNRLLKPEKFEGVDYQPFNENNLQERMFTFFDKLFENEQNNK